MQKKNIGGNFRGLFPRIRVSLESADAVVSPHGQDEISAGDDRDFSGGRLVLLYRSDRKNKKKIPG